MPRRNALVAHAMVKVILWGGTNLRIDLTRQKGGDEP